MVRTNYALSSTSVLLVFLFPQALAKPPGGHLNIEEVDVTNGPNDTTLKIIGVDFDFGRPLKVTVAGAPATITSATSSEIIATVLTVSTGKGQSQ